MGDTVYNVIHPEYGTYKVLRIKGDYADVSSIALGHYQYFKISDLRLYHVPTSDADGESEGNSE